MSKEKFVWEEIINDPARQEEIQRKYLREQEQRKEKEERLNEQYNRREQGRRNRIESEAIRFALAAIGLSVVTFLLIRTGIQWLAWCTLVPALVLGVISCFGFGRVHEMKK